MHNLTMKNFKKINFKKMIIFWKNGKKKHHCVHRVSNPGRQIGSPAR